MNKKDLFIALLRSQIAERGVADIPKDALDGETVSAVLRLADVHDVLGVVFTALSECGVINPSDKIYADMEEAEELSYFRLKRLNHSFKEITETLENFGIDYLPLKGSVIRNYYPDPLMRLSADIDILVREADLDAAVKALLGRQGYKVTSGKTFHDISIYTADGMHLELHFNVKENHPRLDSVLARAWDYAIPVSNKKHEFAFKPEFFAFHLLSHMAYHFTNGGCGVKPFADLWIYTGRVGYDREELLRLCRECGVEDFYNNAMALSRVWFGGEEHTDLTRQMEAHVLLNEICGDVEKGIAIRQARSGGRFSYILGRIFAPYSELKHRYHVLKKWPILLPVFEVVRWFSFLFGDKKRAKRELEMTKRLTAERVGKIKKFYSDVGLSQEKSDE
ncbi:MAG: nucleotidyltransferase family protein [Clostridia bacterium]|nr:nucleotidyltransferase family protein [Clostridia bacterium]